MYNFNKRVGCYRREVKPNGKIETHVVSDRASDSDTSSGPVGLSVKPEIAWGSNRTGDLGTVKVVFDALLTP